MAEPLLKARGLTKRFGGLTANNAIDLDVLDLEVRSIIGPNGAGKTTLVGQLAGEIPPDSGTVVFDGADVTHLAAHERARAGLARSFQISSVMPSLTVLENVLLGSLARARKQFCKIFRPYLATPGIVAEARDALARVGLQDRQDVAASRLSHGERRQLEIAIALATRPKLLLLDEPTAGMGTDETERVVGLIQDLRKSHAVVLVEHDMQVVFSVSDTITVISAGTLIATGTPDAIRNNALVREAYLGVEG